MHPVIVPTTSNCSPEGIATSQANLNSLTKTDDVAPTDLNFIAPSVIKASRFLVTKSSFPIDSSFSTTLPTPSSLCQERRVSIL